ncbi:MAG: proline iminopeptidase-family hydrolase [Lachnospiraceae bacterium]|nr:proline iminopeptidase-family hydrolase [Lachnospiraceae bacterium]
MAKITEGYMPFREYKTYYRIVGEDKKGNGKAPLICLHGGPGSTHNYFEVLDNIADDDDRMVVMYDQIGCGNSYLDGHKELWTKEVWMEELIALREHLGLDECHIIGQSWGGMMQIIYACDYDPKGVKSFIISSGHPSSSLWEREGLRRIKMMPEDMQEAINKALSTGDYTGEAYDRAVTEYMDRYCNYWLSQEELPECCKRPKKTGSESYVEGWGPNEFAPTGTLRDYEYIDRLHEIKIPSLICSGISDLCSPLVAKTMYDEIPDSKWILWERARHTTFVDRHDDYCVELIKWMNAHD